MCIFGVNIAYSPCVNFTGFLSLYAKVLLFYQFLIEKRCEGLLF